MTRRMIDGRAFRNIAYAKSKSEIEAKKIEYQKRGFYTRVTTEDGPKKSYVLWVAKKNLSESEIYRESRKHSGDKGINRNLSIGQAHQRSRKKRR